MIMRWPKGIAAGQVCEEPCRTSTLCLLSSNWVKRINRSLTGSMGKVSPPFQNGKAKDWRNHLHLEMGAARATVTKDWSYIAVRYTKEQIAEIKRAALQNLPRAMSYIGRLGIGVRELIGRASLMKISSSFEVRSERDEESCWSYRAFLSRERDASKDAADSQAIGRPFGGSFPRTPLSRGKSVNRSKRHSSKSKARR